MNNEKSSLAKVLVQLEQVYEEDEVFKLIVTDEEIKVMIDALKFQQEWQGNLNNDEYVKITIKKSDVDEFVRKQSESKVQKCIESIKARTSFLDGCTKWGNKDTKQQAKSYRTMMMYEVADLIEEIIDDVKGVFDSAGKVASPQERTKSAVRATGNRWANENFNATHN